MWDLPVHHDTGLPYLLKNLDLIDPQHITTLFKNLNDERFAVRIKASQELEKYGRWMEGRFKDALVNPPTLEVQRRIEQMLAKLTTQHAGPTAHPRAAGHADHRAAEPA